MAAGWSAATAGNDLAVDSPTQTSSARQSTANRGVAMREHVFDFGTFHSRVDRHRDRAGVEAGEVADGKLGTVVHVQGHAVARADAGSDKRQRATLRFPIELQVAQRPAVEDDG